MNADPREALKSLVDLARVGIRTELLSASAYSMAANSGSGLALLTGSSRRDIRLGRGRCSPIKSDVKRALERRGSATAYEIWEDLGTYSLRGIYKIMRTMEIEGTVKGEYFMRGRRRVKRYRLL
jgi:threonine synthase